MKVLHEYIGWRDKDGTDRVVERGDEVPKDAPAEQVKFWQATGMVEGKPEPKPADKK